MDKEFLLKAKNNDISKEDGLSPYACRNSDAIRLIPEDNEEELRGEFYHDYCRILHSHAYKRLEGKTQVFSYLENDHVTNRLYHSLIVASTAREIGRLLRLNEDLIEAMANGHDIGHTPLGHTGEKFLNEISLSELGEMFNHNIQSVRELMCVEKNGRGLNLTIQTLDGIMCHNGEVLEPTYSPIAKTKEEFLREYELSYTDKEVLKKLRPMTLEGCVVRISDVIGYIGKDVEDAIDLGIINREEVPENVRNVLGTTNSEIVTTIVHDIVKNSMNKPYIKLSDDVFKAIFDLKEFNYLHIYSKANTKEQLEYYRSAMNRIYLSVLENIREENRDSIVYKDSLGTMDSKYLTETDIKRMTIDYIAGMTDDYFKRVAQESKVLTKTN